MTSDLVQVDMVAREMGKILELQVEGTKLGKDRRASRGPAPVLYCTTGSGGREGVGGGREEEGRGREEVEG